MSTISEEIFIQKVTVEVTTASTETAKSVESNIHAFLENQVFPQIEKWLSERFQPLPSKRHVQLSDLSFSFALDPRQMQSGQFQAALSQALIKQLIDQVEGLIPEKAATHQEGNSPMFGSDHLKPRSDRNPVKSLKKPSLTTIESDTYQIINEVQKGFYAWLHFLQYGSKPWFAGSMDPVQMTYAEQGRHWILLKEFRELSTAVLAFPQAMLRLVMQHNEEEVVHLMTYLMADLPTSLEKFNHLNERYDRKTRGLNRVLFLSIWLDKQSGSGSGKWADLGENLWALLEINSFPRKEGIAFWKQVMKIYGFQHQIEAMLSFLWSDQSGSVKNELTKKRGTAPWTKQAFSSDTLAERGEITAFYLGDNLPMIHSGLILIHPFLLAFFQDVGVVGKDKLILNPVLGLHLLHYVATGKLNPFEFELGFEKFLVGWNRTMLYEKQIELTQSQLEKCDRLLESLMGIWQKLKNTGKDTVRTGFLQREGKLMEQPDRYRLVLERKAQDVLLQGLPFSLGVVKLPWQRKLVFVEW